MKLVIQIPAYNEEGELGTTLAALPRSVAGFDTVDLVVVDDGSTDRTAEIAAAAGATVVRLTQHLGLASAFRAGLETALERGADVIINTDADNQYPAAAIPDLVAPILARRADMVIGVRDMAAVREFSPAKRLLQRVGSWVVRQVSGTQVPDATSGFRALSRDAALRLVVLSRFTYTLETIIQAGDKRIALAHVPIATNPKTRPSRLSSSTTHYVMMGAGNILHFYTLYKPLKAFLAIAAVCGAGGLALFLRYAWLVVADINPGGHVQSLIVGAVLLVVGATSALFGMVADLVAINRRLLEEILERLRRHALEK